MIICLVPFLGPPPTKKRPYFQMPQKKMGQYAGQDMLMPLEALQVKTVSQRPVSAPL
jgi:hypothetical protein